MKRSCCVFGGFNVNVVRWFGFCFCIIFNFYVKVSIFSLVVFVYLYCLFMIFRFVKLIGEVILDCMMLGNGVELFISVGDLVI